MRSSTTHDGLTLDVCTRCRGVWFDRHELSAIWTVAITAVVTGGSANARRAQAAASDGGGALAEALVYGPDVGAVVIEGSLRVAGSAIDAIPDAAGFVAEAAGGVFEALLAMVAAALDGL
jgi:hypothetical protein